MRIVLDAGVFLFLPWQAVIPFPSAGYDFLTTFFCRGNVINLRDEIWIHENMALPPLPMGELLGFADLLVLSCSEETIRESFHSRVCVAFLFSCVLGLGFFFFFFNLLLSISVQSVGCPKFTDGQDDKGEHTRMEKKRKSARETLQALLRELGNSLFLVVNSLDGDGAVFGPRKSCMWS